MGFVCTKAFPRRLSSLQILRELVGIPRPIADCEGFGHQQRMIPPIGVVVRQRVNNALDVNLRRHAMNDADLLITSDRRCMRFPKILQQHIRIATRGVMCCCVTRDQCRRGWIKPSRHLVKLRFFGTRLNAPRFRNIALQDHVLGKRRRSIF